MSSTTLSFATFNLSNLQLPGVAMYHGQSYNVEEYQKKIAWIAQSLTQMDADVIGFQELWSPQCLSDVFNQAGLCDQYQLLTQAPPGDFSAVAAAVRKSIVVTEHQWIKNLPDEVKLNKAPGNNTTLAPDYELSVSMVRFSRAVLQLKIKPILGPAITVFITHLKSRLPVSLDEAEFKSAAIKAHRHTLGAALATLRRVVEATGLRIMLNKVLLNAMPVVVLADLNDNPTSSAVALLTQQPVYRSLNPNHHSELALYSTAILQSLRSLRDVHFTYLHQGQTETLDHILVSEHFVEHSQRRKWVLQELKVLNDHLQQAIPHASDHGIVWAVFVYSPITY